MLQPPPKKNRRLEPGQDPWLVVARIVRSRGNKGELLADIETDWPDERFQPGEILLRNRNGEFVTRVVEKIWFHKDRVVIKLLDVDEIGAAEQFRGFEWIIPESERMELPEGECYRYELEGMDVTDEDGIPIGSVVAVNPGEGADLLVLEIAGREVLVPFIQQFVTKLDRDRREIRLAIPPELVELNT